MSVPVFIDTEENEQLLELRRFLKDQGAEISEENSANGIVRDLKQVIEACGALWVKDGVKDSEIESVINSIISMILIVPQDQVESLVTLLCEKLSKPDAGNNQSRNGLRLKIMNTLRVSLEGSSHCAIVYSAMLRLASATDLLHILSPNLDDIKGWITKWKLSVPKTQALLRLLYDILMDCNKQTDKASKVLIEVLGTYTDENASQARDEAIRCIVTSIADPNTYLVDHLLTLKPIKFLEGELIHDLLTIFVSGKLGQYKNFYDNNRDFVTGLGLNHENNMQKMRLLTFMSMAEVKKEISFDSIRADLGLSEEEVESFVIDIVRTRMVQAKLDQMSRKVLIMSSTNRTFGKAQWQQLRDELTNWKKNLGQVMTSVRTLTHPIAGAPAMLPGAPGMQPVPAVPGMQPPIMHPMQAAQMQQRM